MQKMQMLTLDRHSSTTYQVKGFATIDPVGPKQTEMVSSLGGSISIPWCTLAKQFIDDLVMKILSFSIYIIADFTQPRWANLHSSW